MGTLFVDISTSSVQILIMQAQICVNFHTSDLAFWPRQILEEQRKKELQQLKEN